MMNLLEKCIGWKKPSLPSVSHIQLKPHIEKSGPLFIHDSYDEYLYTQAVKTLNPLGDLLEKGQKVESDFSEVVFDLFALFYKAEPEFIEKAQSYLRYGYFQKLISNLSIREKRRKTRFHILNSFIEAMVYAEEFLAHSSKDKEQQKNTSTTNTFKSEEVQQAMKTWGISTTQQKELNFEQVIQLLNLVCQAPEFIKLAEQAGRLRQITIGALDQRLSPRTPTRSGVTLGNNILNALPSELALLTKKETEAAFYKKAMDSNLLVYDHTRKKLHRGPLIVLIDTSDSMAGEKGYVSKAIAASLHFVAKKEKRWLSIIIFSGGKNVKEFIFNPQKSVPGSFVEMITLFYGGGTSFEEGIVMGLKRLEDTNFRGADFIVLSDFDGPFDEGYLCQVRQRKTATGFRMYTLLAPSLSHNQSLLKLSDYIGEINLDFGEKTHYAFKQFLNVFIKRGVYQ